MAKTDNLTDFLTDIADAIREKKGTTGAINPQDFSSEIASIESGGGGSSAVTPPSYSDVNFFDYNGTILYSYTKEQFLALSTMPELPTREGLICQGWNYRMGEAKSHVTNYGNLNIGASYITNNGETRLYIRISAKGRMSVPLYWSQTLSEGVGINWGDGSDTQTITGTGSKTAIHTYVEPGDYVIRLMVRGNCTLELGGGSSYCVMGSISSSKVYCNMLQKVEIGNKVTSISNSAFYNCYSLESITIPIGVTSISNSAFYNCYSLESITIPINVTSLGSSAFYNCYSLASVAIPISVTSLAAFMFYNCYSLASVAIPQSVTTIYSSAFYNCYSLASIAIPQSVASISNGAFSNCTGMAVYDFTKHTSVPTLASTSNFVNIPSDCVIKVPASMLNDWKSATNWASIGNNIIGV